MEAPEIAEQFKGPKSQCEELPTHLRRAWQQMTIHIFKYERKCELVGANYCSLFLQGTQPSNTLSALYKSHQVSIY